MKMNVWRRHSVVLLLVLLVGAFACAALIYSTLWARYNNALQQLEPRSERLEGVVNAGAEIETLLSAASSTVAPLVHPAGETSQNDIQQKLRQMIMASGGTLVSSQVALEPGVDGKLARIRRTALLSGCAPPTSRVRGQVLARVRKMHACLCSWRPPWHQKRPSHDQTLVRRPRLGCRSCGCERLLVAYRKRALEPAASAPARSSKG